MTPKNRRKKYSLGRRAVRLSTHMTENNTSRPEPLSEHARQVEAIYVQNLSQLIGLARKYRLPSALAKEIVHEASLRMLALENPAAIGNLHAYFYKTVAHLAIDKYRELKRHRSNDNLLRRGARDDAHPSPELECAAEEALRALAEYVEDLPGPLQQAAELLIYERRTVREVAQATNLSMHHIRKAWLHKPIDLMHSLKARIRKTP